MTNIVDYFSYYDGTCKELLKLRVNLLNDYVDHFVICESNKTHSGIPIEYKLKERIKEYRLPADKITVIELDIPDAENLIVEDIDYFNSGINSSNINSVKARARERLQRDALIYTLNQFESETLFIVGDCDEIINPLCIKFIADIASNTNNAIIKIPLVYLEGRADLRVYNNITGEPKPWDLSLFICKKKHLLMTRPINIRCNHKTPYPVVYCTQDDKVIQDLGWHFSWMGGPAKRTVKRDAFCHYEDSLPYLKTKSYNNEMTKKLLSQDIVEGSIAPSLESDSVMKLYDIYNLPPLVLYDIEIRNFLFGAN